jgi:hypothetical protein
MVAEARWTLDELVGRVAATLAGPAYPGPPNRRVRDVPDRRAVRWYTTIGLVDRPAAMQGRTALYGVRHLLQIVAIKRCQAQGRSLAQIQAELAGATNETLRRVAGVSGELFDAASHPPPVREAETPTVGQPPAARAGEPPAPSPRRGSRGRFWAEPPTTDAASSPSQAGDAVDDSVTTLAGIGLPGGAVVLLPGQPDRPGWPGEDDIAAIRLAARPLLDLLADRGLLSVEEWSSS